MSAAKKLIDMLKEDIDLSSIKMSLTYLELVEVFPLQPLSSKKHHETALKVMERLIDYTNTHRMSDNGVTAYLQTLSGLIEKYESKKIQSSNVSGGEMLGYLMDLRDLKQTDLSKELGGQSVVSDVLSGKRELNLKQIRALARKLRVDPSVFV